MDSPRYLAMEQEIQTIAVFLHPGKSQQKIDGISRYGADHFNLQLHFIDSDLPAIIDDSTPYLPDSINADLVLDFLSHADLSQDLADLCSRLKIPIICSGKKKNHPWADYPPTCCGLSENEKYGLYGKYFGAPKFKAILDQNDIIVDIEVLKGAPCGASWEAINQIKNTTADEAIQLIGLKTQFFCVADPSGWDPINGKSPVHFAGRIHAKALVEAVERTKKSNGRE